MSNSQRKSVLDVTHQPLAHIVYISRAVRPLSKAALEQLLQNSRQNNQRDGITGVLLHHGSTFIQCIEGSRDKLDALYSHIAVDPRHKNIVKLLDESIGERSFEDWQMGCTRMSESVHLELSTAEWRQTAAKGAGDPERSLGFQTLVEFWEMCLADSQGRPEID